MQNKNLLKALFVFSIIVLTTTTYAQKKNKEPAIQALSEIEIFCKLPGLEEMGWMAGDVNFKRGEDSMPIVLNLRTLSKDKSGFIEPIVLTWISSNSDQVKIAPKEDGVAEVTIISAGTFTLSFKETNKKVLIVVTKSGNSYTGDITWN
jgi:hypothetical protein